MYNIVEVNVVGSSSGMDRRLQWQRCCYFSRYCSLAENELLLIAWPFGKVVVNWGVICGKYSYRWELSWKFVVYVISFRIMGCCALIQEKISKYIWTLGSWVRIPLRAWMFGVFMRLFSICVALCLGSGLTTGWSLVQGVLPSEKWLRNWIRGLGPWMG
jgi:hypothetical protein